MPTPKSPSTSSTRQLAAILFTDMEGYTALMARDEALASRLRQRHRQVLNNCHQQYRGEVVNYFGDGTLSIFPSAVDAVQCAIEMQTAFREEPQVPLRIGIHLGEVVRDKEGLYGNSINIASRLESFATAGSILVSSKIREELANQRDFSFRSLGLFELKNVPRPVEVFAVAHEGLIIPKPASLKGKGKLLEQNAAIQPARLEFFVGREKELKLLRKAWKATQTGRGSIIAIAGEPGIGKTTLVEDFLLELSEADQAPVIARGQCSERLAGTEAYLPFLEILGDLIREEANRTIMKQLAPAWYVQLRPHSVEESKAFEQALLATQERRKREIDSFFREVARLQPLVLFMDDWHWADASSTDLLAYLAPKSHFLSLLIIITYRPADMQLAKHPLLKIKFELQTKKQLVEILLPFLSSSEVHRYLEMVYSHHEFPSGFASKIYNRTEGNPLFMADLVKDLEDNDLIFEENNKWKFQATDKELEDILPESVKGMVQRKISRLSEEDRHILSIAAVQGYEFDSAILASILKQDPWQVEKSLQHLAERDKMIVVLQEKELPGGSLSISCRFVHALYQNALYSSIPPSLRSKASLQIAEELLNQYGEQAEEILQHLAILLETGRDNLRATKYYHLSAQKAQQVSAFHETEILTRKGLAASERIKSKEASLRWQLDLQMLRCQALTGTSGWASNAVEKAYLKAIDLASQVHDKNALFTSWWGLGAWYTVRADFQRAKKEHQKCLNLALEINEKSFVLQAHHLLGDIYWFTGEWQLSFDNHEKALNLYDPGEHMAIAALSAGENPGVSCGVASSKTLWALGFPVKSEKRCQITLQHARELGQALSLAHSLLQSAWLYYFRREPQQVQVRAQEALTIAHEHGMPFYRAWANIFFGWAVASLGSMDEGMQLLEEGILAWEKTGAHLATSNWKAMEGELYIRKGELEIAYEKIRQGLEFAENTGEMYVTPQLRWLEGKIHLKNKEEQHAESAFLQAIKIANAQGSRMLELRASNSLTGLWRSQGRIQEAYDQLKPIYNWFTEGFDTVDLKEAKSLLTELEKSLHEQQSAPSIAVLPFKDLSPEKDQEYFCDGLSDEVITDLSGIKHITVISNNSSLLLKGMNLGTQEISRKLGVRYLLTGSVRKAGERVRITAQLIDARADHQIWAEKFTGTLQDIFDLQEKISRRIISGLNLKLSSKEAQQLLERPIEDIRAYDVYLQAHREIWLLSEDSLDRAAKLIDNSLEMIGPNALLLATKGQIHLRYIMLGVRPDRIHLEEAVNCLDQLQQLKPESLDRYLLQGMVNYKKADIQQATNDFKLALQYNPNNRDALFFLSLMYILAGHSEAATPYIKRLIEVDPLTAANHCMPGYILACQGDFKGAVPHYRNGFEMDPSNPFISFVYCFLKARAWPPEELIPILLKLEPLVPHLTFGRHARFLRLALEGKKEAALAAAADKQLQEEARWDDQASWWLACTYALIDEKEPAIDWLENAVRLGYFNYPFFSKHDPFLENLRGEKRFQDLMEKVKRKWEGFEV